MFSLSTVLAGLMLASSAMAQKDFVRASTSGGSKTLQPWLLGLTAMVVFLFIVFVLLLVHRVWCKKEKSNYNEENPKLERAELNVYTNGGLEDDDKEEEKEEARKDKGENKKAKGKKEEDNEDQKITAM
ncbi:small integral membrane protein 24 [Bombina bombina]|uniref:small integral membrane protein 24 n=1 Tax=Bombina bombina TaxID=8345 RepID=UPI00235A6E5F|nr:small integral membrane protein 24 [Bombina bombina]